MLRITHNISIDEMFLSESFVRASGPGGQNVNKVASAVQLRFDLGACNTLDADVKNRARRLAGSRITKDDILIIQADNNRTQKANREEARRRLAQLIRAAVPSPIKRKKTRPTKGSVERRITGKKQRSQIKSGRRVSIRNYD